MSASVFFRLSPFCVGLLVSTLAIAAPPKAAAPAAAATAESVYKVNADASKVDWVGKKAVGSSHKGTVKVKSGELKLKGKDLSGGKIVMDMNSIYCSKDEDISKENCDKLIGHLKSDDFFGTQKFPEASYQITSVVFGKGGLYNVTGDLTIKGKTQQGVMFDADIKPHGEVLNIKGKFEFDRTKFDVMYNTKNKPGLSLDQLKKFAQELGDKIIEDKVELNIDIVAKK